MLSMTYLSDEDEDIDGTCEYYGKKVEPQGVTLPNFRLIREIDTQRVLAIIDANLPSELNYRGYVPFQCFKFGFDELELSTTIDLYSVCQSIIPQVENHHVQSRRAIDGLRWSLRDLVTAELANCEQPLNIFNAGLIVLRLLEEVTGFIRDHRRSILGSSQKDKGKFWALDETKNIKSYLDTNLDMAGVDLHTVQGAATHILGKTPAQICRDILPEWRIMHCENILRNDLQAKFSAYRETLRETLMEEDIQSLKKYVPKEFHRGGDGHAAKEQLVEHLLKVRTTFHGTRRENVPSIVQHGFLKPGSVHPVTGNRLGIWNGSVYGQGIYTSPEAWYALMYSERGSETSATELPGLKLLVCATIMGRTAGLDYDDEWWTMSEPYPGSDSHVNPSHLAYISFNPAQVLPCYVLHLDWAEKNNEEVYSFIRHISTSGAGKARAEIREEILPGDKQRLKQELLAKGKKFFAYGFGPVKGRNLVIEDVAEVDDDEEDYGDYQATRIDAHGQNRNFFDWGQLDGETIHDEYAAERKTKINRRHVRVCHDAD